MSKNKTAVLIESLDADMRHNIQVGAIDVLRYAKEIIDSCKGYIEYWAHILNTLTILGHNCGSMSDLDILAVWFGVFKTEDDIKKECIELNYQLGLYKDSRSNQDKLINVNKV